VCSWFLMMRGSSTGVVRTPWEGEGGSDWMKVFFSTVGEKRTLFWRLIFGVKGFPLGVPFASMVSSEWLDPLIISSPV